MNFNQYNDKEEKQNKKAYHKFRQKPVKNKHNKYSKTSDYRRSTWYDTYNRQQSNSRQDYYHNNQDSTRYQNKGFNQDQHIWYAPHYSHSNQEVQRYHKASDSVRDRELLLPGSEAERSCKIELDKKRIKEALSLADNKNDEISTILTNDKREKINKLGKPNDYVPLQELCLTPNDYKDIGSVDTSQVDAVTDSGDIVLNVTNYDHPKNNGNKQNTPLSTDRVKPLQSSGWRVSDVIEMETVPSSSIQSHHISSVGSDSPAHDKIVNRVDGSQEMRFKGSISSADTARIGRLYRSFLKSRLSGRAGRVSSVNKYNSCKDSQPKSFVKVKSVAVAGQSPDNTALQKRDNCEIEMPLPVKVKLEVAERSNYYEQHDENVEAIEADEFYKEFSHLLVHPDYIIPSDILEKLGLEDLLEMNLSLIDKNHINSENTEKRQNDSRNYRSQNASEQPNESLLHVKSVDVLNSQHMSNCKSDSYVSSMQVGMQSGRSACNTMPLSDLSASSGSRRKISASDSGNETLIHADVDKERLLLQCQELNRESFTSKHSCGVQEEIADTVAAYRLKHSNTTVLENTVTCVGSKNENTVTANCGNQKCGGSCKNVFKGSSEKDEHPDTKLFDISSNILRLFVIDKQIQELMEEKTKIYNELLSQKEIASTLFNSWADNELKQQRSTVSNDSQQFSNSSKSSGLVKQNCSITGSSSICEQSKKHSQNNSVHIPNIFQSEQLKNSQNEVGNSSLAQSCPASSFEMSDVSNRTSAENSKISCVSLSKLIGSCKENLSTVKREMVDDVLNLYGNDNNSADQQNVCNKNGNKSVDHQNECNKLMKNDIHSDIKPKSYTTHESDKEKLLHKSNVCEDVNKKTSVRASENSSNRSIHSSSHKRKGICGDKCVTDDCNSKLHNKKKKLEEAVDIIDFIHLDTNSDDSDVVIENEKIDTEKTNYVPRSSTDTFDNLQKLKSKVSLKDFENPQKPVLCLKVCGKFCYAGNRDGELLKYFVNTGEIVTTLKGHKAGINSIVLYRKLVITGSCDNTIRCFSVETDKQLHFNDIGCPVQSLDERNGFLYAGTKFGNVFIFSLQKESFQSVGEPLNLTDCNILAIKAAKEGARNVIIVAARGQPVTVRDASSGLLLRSFSWCATVYCLQLFRESPLVYCGTNSKSVVVTDFTTGETKFECNTGRGVVQIIFSYGLMFTACYDGNVYVYDVQAETLVTRITVCKQMLLCMDVLKYKIIVSTSASEVKVIPFPGVVKRYIKGTSDSAGNISL